MDFDADTALFFSDFAHPGELAGEPVTGTFEETIGDERGMTASQLTYELPACQVPAAVYGQLLVIPQGRFSVREVSSADADTRLLHLVRLAGG